MTNLQAKHILLRYRPGSPDAAEPEIIEALALVRQSPDLQTWFDLHCAMQQAIRTRLKRFPPPGLKEQILSERKAHTAGFWPKTPASLITALAALTVIAVLAAFWLRPYLSRPDDARLEVYRVNVVGRVLRAYKMDLETNSLASVRTFLSKRKADAGWELSQGLEQTTVTGCGVLNWADKKVSMICFRSGRPLPPGQQTDVFLFVVDKTVVHDLPTAGKPEFAPVLGLATASWVVDGRVYVLAVQGSEDQLKELLPEVEERKT